MELDNGTILPHGLLSIDTQSTLAGFNKTYQNHALRAGIVIKSYGIDDKDNRSKLAVEYDVVVIEQDTNRAITPITYRHCLSSEGLGSIADFFETKLREQKSTKTPNNKNTFRGQDGAIVLLLCLDGTSEKAIIVGSLTHPDRGTKLKGNGQILAGEFNGLSIDVKDDGSANLTFKGATDNKGKPKDASQGNTTVDIETDGSIQFKHKGVTQRMEKEGKFLLTTEDSTTVHAKKEIDITTDDNFKLKVARDATAQMINLTVAAMGSATLSMASLGISSGGDVNIDGKMFNLRASQILATAGSLSFSMTSGLTELISNEIILDGLTYVGGAGGLPALLPTTQFVGIGNLGIPVVSTAVGPFAVKSFLI